MHICMSFLIMWLQYFYEPVYTYIHAVTDAQLIAYLEAVMDPIIYERVDREIFLETYISIMRDFESHPEVLASQLFVAFFVLLYC